MENFWISIIEIHDHLYSQIGFGLYIVIGFLIMIAIVAQWRLYEKADLPGVACVVPVWNAIVFLKLAGRPASHVWYFFVPLWGQFYFTPKVWIEVCQSFGKRTMTDYIMVVLLNGLYILNMGLSYDIEYYGPVYGKDIETVKKNRTTASSAQLA